MLRQISIYAENKKGTLADITRILLEKNINILGSMTDDGAEYGCNRMVVSDADTACEALTQAGYLTRVRNVIGVEVEDKVGNLNHLLNVYLSCDRASGLPIMVFSADDIWEVEAAIKEKGFLTI